MLEMTEKEGALLVKKARENIGSELTGTRYDEPKAPFVNTKRGIFVTLHTHPKNRLRGCIGFIGPVYTLKDAIRHASHAAAFDDDRFPPLEKSELDKITIEVSILTDPEPIKFKTPEELLKKITPKKDGLIITLDPYRGLFLPQVWDQLPEKEQFLENLCYKAGIPDKDAWKEKGCKIERFRVQVFREKTPGGEIIQE